MAAKRNLCKVSAVCCDAMNLSGYYIYHVIVLFPIAVADSIVSLETINKLVFVM
jgi:hypothetical protein